MAVTTRRKLKVLHLISQRPDSTGSGTYVGAMLRQAAARGHANFLVAGVESGGSATASGLAPNRCILVRFRADVAFQIVGMSDVMPYQSRTFASLSPQELDEYESAFSQAIQTAVARSQPDVIHTHHLWILSSLARQLFPGIAIVATCHGSDLRQFQQCPHLRERVLRGCRQLDAVMSLSQAQKEEIVQRYALAPHRVVVVGGGYDDALFVPAPKPSPNPVRLIYAGKLSKSKGVPWLLRALRRIETPPWRLHLVGAGSGEEAAACLDYARELGSRVEIHGAVPHEELALLMRQAHILVLPSLYEGLGLVVLEGLASGCRIVATDLPGVRELLGNTRPDFISLVTDPSGDRLLDALRKQVNAACKQPDIDLSAVREILTAFSWRGAFERVEQVYSSALSSP